MRPCHYILTQAETELVPTGKAKPGEMLEKAADAIMSCFRVCVSDRCVSIVDCIVSVLLSHAL